MKRMLAVFGLVALLAQAAGAWRPSGWVYADWPWAYDSASGDWYWFNAADTQWVHGYPPEDGWKKLGVSGLAAGWTYYGWPFAYAQGNGAWHYLNVTDRQWCVNMRTGAWSRLGVAAAPDGMVAIASGRKVGWDTIYNQPFDLWISDLYVDIYEVPQAHWDAVRAWGGFHGYTDLPTGAAKGPSHPVHSVNWYDCLKWCNARSERAEREPVYYTDAAFTQVYKTGEVAAPFVKTTAQGFRLPTEEEWERLARAGVDNGSFPFPSDPAQIYHLLANYYSHTSYLPYDISPTRGYHPTWADGTQPYTSPVGTFGANAYGLFDMAGNVREWCFDKHPDLAGSNRALRGGSWWDFANICLVKNRTGASPGTRNQMNGFRAVMRANP